MKKEKQFSGKKNDLSDKKRNRNRRLQRPKGILLIMGLAVLTLSLVGGSIAYLVANTGPKENNLTYAKVSSEITETFDGDTKSNVSIKNTGNTDAYIRTAIIVTWQDSQGNVYSEAPIENTDYTLELDTSSGWFMGNDGYYYFNRIVQRDASTPILIVSCSPEDREPEGYKLSVEILADAIQSSPEEAIEDSWDMTVLDDDTISK